MRSRLEIMDLEDRMMSNDTKWNGKNCRKIKKYNTIWNEITVTESGCDGGF